MSTASYPTSESATTSNPAGATPLLPPSVQAPVPAILRGGFVTAPRWLVWRYEFRNGKLTKVPYSATSHRMPKTTEPADWTDLATAFAALRISAQDANQQ